jgi:iron(III) transport system substrate-binding protein
MVLKDPAKEESKMGKRHGRLTGRLVVMAAVLGSTVLAACGSSSDDSSSGGAAAPTASASVSKSGAQALYPAAKKEGSVVWQVGFDTEEAATLVSGFEKAYPGIDVKVVSYSDPALPAKLTSESAAGKVSVDVAMGRTDTLRPLLDRNVLVAEDWTKLSDVKPEDVLLDGKMVNVYDFVIGWFYNKNKVAAGDVPTKWEDLADPKWQDRKLLIQANGDIGLDGLVLSGQWTLDQAKAYLDTLKPQKVVSEARGTPIVTKVGTGQYPLGVAPITVVPGAIKDGAPLALAPLGPVVSIPNGVFQVRDSAHPNAAKLLISWLGSSGAKPEWQALGRGGAQECADSQLAQMLCDAHIKVLEVNTLEEAAKIEAVNKLGRDALGVHE